MSGFDAEGGDFLTKLALPVAALVETLNELRGGLHALDREEVEVALEHLQAQAERISATAFRFDAKCRACILSNRTPNPDHESEV